MCNLKAVLHHVLNQKLGMLCAKSVPKLNGQWFWTSIKAFFLILYYLSLDKDMDSPSFATKGASCQI